MQEYRGTIGFCEPAPRFNARRELYAPAFALIRLQRIHNDRPPQTVGIVTFNEYGCEETSRVDGMQAVRSQLQILDERQQSGWPVPETPDLSALPEFVGRFAATLTDVDAARRAQENPLHLPMLSRSILTVSLHSAAEVEVVPDAWRSLLN